MKKIIILGSTGSIGTQAVEIILNNLDKYKVVGLSTNKNAKTAIEQAKKLNCKAVLIADNEAYERVKFKIPQDIKIYKSIKNIEKIIDIETDVVLNALVGSIGLEATIATLKKKVKLCLANKESLVVGGDIINKYFRDKKEKIIPVDSEHSAIFQLFLGEKEKEVRNIIITASGGPFRKSSKEEMKKATPNAALAHPRWKMGPKITIDSATMVNKGLEVIEAHYLFDMPYEKIKVVVHPQSIVHSMLEFVDGSLKAHLGPTDMRVPIQYALSYPERFTAPAGFTDFTKQREITFEKVDFTKFKALKLAYEAGIKGKGYPVAYNAANEIAVAAFLDGKIKLTDITNIIEKILSEHNSKDSFELEIVKEIDEWARRRALKTIKDLSI